MIAEGINNRKDKIMIIDIHCLNCVILGANEVDVIEIMESLGVDITLYRYGKFGHAETFIYKFDGQESIFIRINRHNESGYVMINLNGSFFDHSPDFNMKHYLDLLSRHRFTIKQIDIGFNDNEKCLRMKDIKRWCMYPEKYCTGSLVSARKRPEKVVMQRKLVRIQLGSARSKANYGTIYRRPDTRFIRIEIKLRDPFKIDFLMESFRSGDITEFNQRCLYVLISCVNFVDYHSRKKRALSQYKMLPAWAQFIGSDVKRLNWRQLKSEKEAKRAKSDRQIVDQRLRRLSSTVRNEIARLSVLLPEDEVLQRISGEAGFDISRRT